MTEKMLPRCESCGYLFVPRYCSRCGRGFCESCGVGGSECRSCAPNWFGVIVWGHVIGAALGYLLYIRGC